MMTQLLAALTAQVQVTEARAKAEEDRAARQEGRGGGAAPST